MSQHIHKTDACLLKSIPGRNPGCRCLRLRLPAGEQGTVSGRCHLFLLLFRAGGDFINGMTTDDMDLVREFARTGSEGAFAALVAQHIDLVYSVALRQVRDPHLSEEITQTVFIILARRAGTLGPKAILPGWLYRTTRFTCAKALTTVVRRQ